MEIYRFVLIVSFVLILSLGSEGVEILDVRVEFSLPKGQVLYITSFYTKDKTLKIAFDKEIKSIKLNGIKFPFKKFTEKGVFLYTVELPKGERFELEILSEYDILRECRNRGIVVFSEVMKTLPYIIDDIYRGREILTTVTVDLQVPEDIDLAVEGRVVPGAAGRVLTLQRKYNSPIVIGYLDSFSVALGSTSLSIVSPKGNEGAVLEIVSFMNLLAGIITTKFDLKLSKEIKVVYFPWALLSESIGDTIILSKIDIEGDNYFSNLEKLDNFVLIAHEVFHSLIKGSVDESVLGLIEGFIQYLGVECLSDVFGSSYVKEAVYNNYISQVRYSSFVKDRIGIVEYRKYPLVFRYISSVVGELSLVSLFKYLTTLERSITMDVFREAFRNVVGINFDTFFSMFDGLPVLWNLEVVVSDRSVSVFSTAPIRVNTTLYVLTSEFETNVSVEVPKSSSFTLSFSSEIKKVAINHTRDFPELFYHDNYVGGQVPKVVADFLEEVAYVVNTEDFSRIRAKKIIPSRLVWDKLTRYVSMRRSVFGSGEIRIGVENVVRYRNQIVVEMIIHSSTSYRQGFIIISYGKSYYISDISIIM